MDVTASGARSGLEVETLLAYHNRCARHKYDVVPIAGTHRHLSIRQRNVFLPKEPHSWLVGNKSLLTLELHLRAKQ